MNKRINVDSCEIVEAFKQSEKDLLAQLLWDMLWHPVELPRNIRQSFKLEGATIFSLLQNHHGQIVPIEDVEKIFRFTNSIVRTSCICRHITHAAEKRYCYGVSMGPNGGKFMELLSGLDTSFLNGPDSKGLETISKDEAMASFKEHERQGLCHSIWTFVTPFIAGICNCGRPDCLAMKSTLTYDFPSMYRAEYVAKLDPDLCGGCRQCMGVCQFGAVSCCAGSKKAVIDVRRCYGCGICRSVCEKEAIKLEERSKVPVAAGLW